MRLLRKWCPSYFKSSLHVPDHFFFFYKFVSFISKEELSCTIFSLQSWQDCYALGTFLVVELQERINIILSCSQSFVAAPLKNNSTRPLTLAAMQATVCIKHFLLPESRGPMKVMFP